ncbi:hypothetical protein BBJ28_00004136 [Nothophytophthora sp. Chile5]|nr:hypothetical protein BBJ28_00004136 [Nothophytophthora sp. Chile5]
MARNEEKAQSLLNRWTSMKQDFADTFKKWDAERWRRQIIREISKKVADIQNGACCLECSFISPVVVHLVDAYACGCLCTAGSGEHVIRDLNDEINKRIREKRHWERRIVQLGGSDYARTQPQAYDADGSAVRGAGGYKYFGAAKNLPGVRELFQKEAREPRKRSRQDMYKHIEPDYYGFRDDEDEQQLEDEQEAEKKLRQRAMDGWDAAETKRKAQIAELVRSDLKPGSLCGGNANVCLFLTAGNTDEMIRAPIAWISGRHRNGDVW